tara:strand:+ start:2403 stop:2681 length:279 start_codon:yes stop_codon:yes gene_type:complete
MKIGKETNRHCPKCNKHTVNTISIYKAGKQRGSSLGARNHEKDRKGYGGQKFPELKRTAKTTKKITLRYKCKECSKVVMGRGFRIRKLEIVA